MGPDRLFIETLRSLHNLLDTDLHDEYRWTKASGELRLLLLDSEPLAHKVNRERHFVLTFDILSPMDLALGDDFPKPEFAMTPMGLFPGHFPQSKSVRTLKLDPFLGATVIYASGVACSVRDVISFVAHVRGGVHSLPPRTAADGALGLAMNNRLVGLPAPVAALWDIARVTITALSPLADSIVAGGD